MSTKFRAHGSFGVIGPEQALEKLIQSDVNRDLVVQGGLTDNSGGTEAADFTLVTPATQVDAAASGSDLASAASLVAALDTVKNALATIYPKANALATRLGLTNVTYSGGGSDGGGTIAAITVATTGAATGAQATETNASIATLIQAMEEAKTLTNELCVATGQAEVIGASAAVLTRTIAAITNSGGADADPGVKKAAADIALGVLADNIATIAAAINRATTYSAPHVVVA